LPDFKYSSTDPINQSLLESPSGWSDLPSDTEEMFFFSPEEVADFRNEKCQRLVEQAQEERVKARSEEEKEMLQDSVNGEHWGNSDEEVSLISRYNVITLGGCSVFRSPMIHRRISCGGQQYIYFHRLTLLSWR